MVTHSPAHERTYRAIADPIRRGILDELRACPRTVNELAELFPVSRPAISRHLRKLRQAALVRERRVGRTRVYQFNPQPLAEIDRWLARSRMFWTANLIGLKNYVESPPPPTSPPPDPAHPGDQS